MTGRIRYGLIIPLLLMGSLLFSQTNNLDDILKTSDSLAALYGSAPTSTSSSNEKRITAMGGGTLTVPEGSQWVVKNVSVSDGSGFNINVASLDIQDTLQPGEKVKIPVFATESHFLDKPGDAIYTFTIIENPIKDE